MHEVIFWFFLLALSITKVSAEQFYLVLEGGSVVDPETGPGAVCSIGIRDGKIFRMSPQTLTGRRVLDAHPSWAISKPDRMEGTAIPDFITAKQRQES